MNTAFDPAWMEKLRFRLEDFRSTNVPAVGEPWSIKVRCPGWKFDRESTPQSFIEIDRWLRTHPSLKVWLMDHSTGPEILCYVRTVNGVRCIEPLVLELLLGIVRQASSSFAAGGNRGGKIDILVRGFDENNQYLETTIISGLARKEAPDFQKTMESFTTRGFSFRLQT